MRKNNILLLIIFLLLTSCISVKELRYAQPNENLVLNSDGLISYDNIPKYRIIFSTNHPDGIILMAENMNKTWDNILSAERRFQGVLFDEYELYYDESETPSGEIINILKINNNKIGFKELYLELIKKFGFKFIKKDYVKIINDLENQGVLKIIRTPKYNKKNKLNTSFDYKNNNIMIILLEK